MKINNITSYIETLSIGVTMTIGEYAIIDKLANFIQKFTLKLTIQLHYGNTSKLLELLESRSNQHGHCRRKLSKRKLSHIKYSTEDYIAVCATSHHFTKEPHTIHDLISEHHFSSRKRFWNKKYS